MAAPMGAAFICVPSMIDSLEVEVPRPSLMAVKG
jgi:hypothetical protein